MVQPRSRRRSSGHGFPDFHKGDVLIQLGHQTYRLNSQTLSNCSLYFADLLNDDDALLIPPKRLKQGDTIRFKLILHRQNMEDCKLYLEGPNSNNETLLDSAVRSQDERSSSMFRAVDNFLRSIHHLSPVVSQASVAACQEECLQLLEVAEAHGSVHIVKEYIERSLLRFDEEIYKAISLEPINWAECACRLESEHLFFEAIIHVVGQWNNLSEADVASLTPEIEQVCRQKAMEVFEKKMILEKDIIGYYPAALQRTGEGVSYGKTSYENQIFSWMALSFWKQWFGQAIVQGRGCRASDGGKRFYTEIREGGDAYIDAQARKTFHESFQMTDKSKECISTALEEWRIEFSAIIEPWFANHSHLNLIENDVPYLLYCPNKREDCPWNWPSRKKQDVAYRKDSEDQESKDGASSEIKGKGDSQNLSDSQGSGLNDQPGNSGDSSDSEDMYS
ncbi:MAG: hypothetical protein M1814_001910 [Vezdaea aestivalis]|nr:MAG: hypothetical protein M1814_001910 [Vezdaea aestivalis]